MIGGLFNPFLDITIVMFMLLCTTDSICMKCLYNIRYEKVKNNNNNDQKENIYLCLKSSLLAFLFSVKKCMLTEKTKQNKQTENKHFSST